MAKSKPKAKPKANDEQIVDNGTMWFGKNKGKEVKELPPDLKRKLENSKQQSALAESVPALLNTAGDLELKHDLDGARAAYDKVLALEPNNVSAHHRLAVIADMQSQYGVADQHYLAALKQRPNDANVLSDLGYSHYLRGNDQQSERFLLQAADYDPQHRSALVNLAHLYARQNRYDEALATFRRAGSELEAQQQIARLFPQGPPPGSTQLAGGSAAGRPSGAVVAGMNSRSAADDAGLGNAAWPVGNPHASAPTAPGQAPPMPPEQWASAAPAGAPPTSTAPAPPMMAASGSPTGSAEAGTPAPLTPAQMQQMSPQQLMERLQQYQSVASTSAAGAPPTRSNGPFFDPTAAASAAPSSPWPAAEGATPSNALAASTPGGSATNAARPEDRMPEWMGAAQTGTGSVVAGGNGRPSESSPNLLSSTASALPTINPGSGWPAGATGAPGGTQDLQASMPSRLALNGLNLQPSVAEGATSNVVPAGHQGDQSGQAEHALWNTQAGASTAGQIVPASASTGAMASGAGGMPSAAALRQAAQIGMSTGPGLMFSGAPAMASRGSSLSAPGPWGAANTAPSAAPTYAAGQQTSPPPNSLPAWPSTQATLRPADGAVDANVPPLAGVSPWGQPPAPMQPPVAPPSRYAPLPSDWPGAVTPAESPTQPVTTPQSWPGNWPSAGQERGAVTTAGATNETLQRPIITPAGSATPAGGISPWETRTDLNAPPPGNASTATAPPQWPYSAQ